MALSKMSTGVVLAFATSLFASVDTPEQLLRALTDAAKKGDQAAFISNLSDASRHSLTQADATAEQLAVSRAEEVKTTDLTRGAPGKCSRANSAHLHHFCVTTKGSA